MNVFDNMFPGAASAAGLAAMASGMAGTTDKKDLPKAKFWLNVGKRVEYTDAEGQEQTRFVSLPIGIPLDTMNPIDIKSRNVEIAQLQSAQNGLLAQLIANAEASLEPGESKILNLEIEIRRVNEAVEVPPADASNPFTIDVDF